MAYSKIRSNALRIQIALENRVSKNVSHFIAKVSMFDLDEISFDKMIEQEEENLAKMKLKKTKPKKKPKKKKPKKNKSKKNRSKIKK